MNLKYKFSKILIFIVLICCSHKNKLQSQRIKSNYENSNINKNLNKNNLCKGFLNNFFPSQSIYKKLLLFPFLSILVNSQHYYLREDNLEMEELISFTRDNSTICDVVVDNFVHLTANYPTTDMLTTSSDEDYYIYTIKPKNKDTSEIIFGKQDDKGKKLWQQKIFLENLDLISRKIREDFWGNIFILGNIINKTIPNHVKGILLKANALGTIKEKVIFEIDVHEYFKTAIYNFNFIEDKIVVVSNFHDYKNCTNFQSLLHFFDYNLIPQSDSYLIKNMNKNKVHINEINTKDNNIYLGGWAAAEYFENIPVILKLNNKYEMDWNNLFYFEDYFADIKIDSSIHNIINTGKGSLIIDGLVYFRPESASNTLFIWYLELSKTNKIKWIKVSRLLIPLKEITNSYLKTLINENDELISFLSSFNQSYSIISRLSNGKFIDQFHLEPFNKKLLLLSMSYSSNNNIHFNALNIKENDESKVWFGKIPFNFSLLDCFYFNEMVPDNNSIMIPEKSNFSITKENNLLKYSDLNINSKISISDRKDICHLNPTNDPTLDPTLDPTNLPTRSPTRNNSPNIKLDLILGICLTLIICLSIPLIIFYCCVLRNKRIKSLDRYFALNDSDKNINIEKTVITEEKTKISVSNNHKNLNEQNYFSPSLSMKRITMEGAAETKQ
ncbi:MAG: hypothetical protein GY830_01330 [Bacteroidetes bacterium]|nr:hypothetical protein [Bacteroidota bacterium]